MNGRFVAHFLGTELALQKADEMREEDKGRKEEYNKRLEGF